MHYSHRRYRKVELERSAVPPTKYRLGCGSGWCGNHVGSPTPVVEVRLGRGGGRVLV